MFTVCYPESVSIPGQIMIKWPIRVDVTLNTNQTKPIHFEDLSNYETIMKPIMKPTNYDTN